MTKQPFSLLDNSDKKFEDKITYFGFTDSRNKREPFGIKQEDRSRHVYVIGKTGMGKSTLLENMAAQDILSGNGVCFIDPHGGSAEKLLDYVPEERIQDVLYFAPFDLEYPISFNVLENVDADKRHLVVAGLMSSFEKIWVDAWSARMAYILQNTIGALLEFPGATLLSVNRMYIDKEYRKNVVSKITDSSIRSFWVDEYSKYTDRYAQEATPAIQNKIGQFASNALVRNVIGQPESSFDIRTLMDEKKIFIVNLSKGRVGEGNANLLGSMLITKIYLAAMSRADTNIASLKKLPPFHLFVDEFQNFANKTFADILSEARKYKLALTIAHQYIEQMADEVRAAVFGNVGTMMTFRVGAYDADVLEKEFAPVFGADDLVNLGARQIYLKLMIDGISSQPFSATTMPPIEEPEINHRDRAIAFSRSTYARPRGEIEKTIDEWVSMKYEDPDKEAKEEARAKRKAQREQDSTPQRQPAQRKHSDTKKDDPEYKKDLRDLLTQMTEKEQEKKKPVPKKQVSKKPPQTDSPQTPTQQKPPQKRDDGKGITEEGRSELRDLLSTLTKGQKENSEQEAKPEEKKTSAEPNNTDTNTKTKQPNEIPKEKMEEMLSTKKPEL
jgi:hypothetical protein